MEFGLNSVPLLTEAELAEFSRQDWVPKEKCLITQRKVLTRAASLSVWRDLLPWHVESAFLGGTLFSWFSLDLALPHSNIDSSSLRTCTRIHQMNELTTLVILTNIQGTPSKTPKCHRCCASALRFLQLVAYAPACHVFAAVASSGHKLG